MDFTFGIITTKTEDELSEIISSIEKQGIPNHEIIVVGGESFFNPKINHIPFDESIKSKWITKKKNLIVKNSNFENIVLMHDYVKLNDNWYRGQLLSGNNFEIRMDIILNKNGLRFRDWCVWPDNTLVDGTSTESLIKEFAILPYDENSLNTFQYISGCYWVCKKTIMEEFPLNEDLLWGESEDVEWSKRIRSKYKFSMNTNSIVHLTKQKDTIFKKTSDEIIKKLKEIK